MPEKLRYEIDLSTPIHIPVTTDLDVRTVTEADLRGLARLILDAYVGTIDYEGETLDDAIEGVRAFLTDDDSMLDRSYLVEDDGEIISAVLVSTLQGQPFIGYVMTLPSHKGQGFARLAVAHALQHLAADGHDSVVLYITNGNTPSENLFRSLGAVQIQR